VRKKLHLIHHLHESQHKMDRTSYSYYLKNYVHFNTMSVIESNLHKQQTITHSLDTSVIM
jgi:hypothetical protein